MSWRSANVLYWTAIGLVTAAFILALLGEEAPSAQYGTRRFVGMSGLACLRLLYLLPLLSPAGWGNIRSCIRCQSGCLGCVGRPRPCYTYYWSSNRFPGGCWPAMKANSLPSLAIISRLLLPQIAGSPTMATSTMA